MCDMYINCFVSVMEIELGECIYGREAECLKRKRDEMCCYMQI